MNNFFPSIISFHCSLKPRKIPGNVLLLFLLLSFFSAVVSFMIPSISWFQFTYATYTQTVVHTPNRAKANRNTQILIINRYYNLIGFSSTLMCASFRFIEIGWLVCWLASEYASRCACEWVSEWWSRPKPAEYNSVLIMLEFICWSVCFFLGKRKGQTKWDSERKSENKVSGGLCVMYNNEMHVSECVCLPMRQVRTINSWDGGKFINLR